MGGEYMPTLWDFFLEQASIADSHWRDIENTEAFEKLRTEVSDNVPGGFWTATRGAVEESLQQALQVTMGDIIGGAWNRFRDLLEYRDPAKHPPDEVVLFPVMRHAIRSVHRPRIELLVGDRPVSEIEFEADLVLEIDAATLKIRAGKIEEIQTGACRGMGALRCGVARLVEVASRDIQLPGRISFGQGLPIAETPAETEGASRQPPSSPQHP
jgi:hypothetical protein